MAPHLLRRPKLPRLVSVPAFCAYIFLAFPLNILVSVRNTLPRVASIFVVFIINACSRCPVIWNGVYEWMRRFRRRGRESPKAANEMRGRTQRDGYSTHGNSVSKFWKQSCFLLTIERSRLTRMYAERNVWHWTLQGKTKIYFLGGLLCSWFIIHGFLKDRILKIFDCQFGWT